MAKKLPLGIQSIREILEEDKLYVDKTGFALDLIENGKHYFMSRPRRFGKSLFLNTLEEIFKGNQPLFKGLAIDQKGYDWEAYPVLSFNFSQISNRSFEKFEASLEAELRRIGKLNALLIEGPSIEFQLKVLIESLAQKKRVVVLVDEYDSAIINNLKNLELVEKNRELLKDFFATLKSLDRYIKFTFVTGVSKFSQVSLFSGPNHLKDITMDPRYAAMMGYTEAELKISFKEHLQEICKMRAEQGRSTSKEELLDELRTWYNGYRFSKEKIAVYNPFSTLNFMENKEPESYWYSSGTPSFLIDQVRKRPEAVASLRETTALKITLSDISRLDRIHFAALLFQTGYLTIHGYHPEEHSYVLDFPNKEVKEAFFNSLLQEFAEVDPLEVTRAGKELRRALETFDLNAFIQKINAQFAKMPYSVFNRAKEGFYQAIFFTFLESSGMRTLAEVPTNIGRIDLMTETSEAICIFELKLDQKADIALTQAETKKYKERFSESKKHTLVMGITFSSTSRNISDWKGLLYLGTEKIRDILPGKKGSEKAG